MRFWRVLIFKGLTCGPFVRIFIAAALVPACMCGMFSTDAPLQNNRPRIIGPAGLIKKTLQYPDSMVCTLSVCDLNDTQLNVHVCVGQDSLDTACTLIPPPAMGYLWLKNLPGTQEVALSFSTLAMGTYYGHVHIIDPDSAGLKVPYVISVLMNDSLRKHLDPLFWITDSNSSNITFSLTLSDKLQFLFQGTGDSTGDQTGIRSKFSIRGDLETSINFQLRDDMISGFEISYYLSTSPGTGVWDGDNAGFYITGITANSLVRFTTKSINLATESRELVRNTGQTIAGRLTLTRTGDTAGYSFTPFGESLNSLTMNKFYFPGDSTVYVHARMKVDDLLKTRHCFWSDFELKKGTVSWSH